MRPVTRDIILLSAGQFLGDTQYLRSMIEGYPALFVTPVKRGDCKNDHGDRTNHRLKDQPFYARNKTGKMKSW